MRPVNGKSSNFANLALKTLIRLPPLESCVSQLSRGGSQVVSGQRSIIENYSQAHNCYMATARAFKLSEDINLNLGNKNININKGYARAPDLESKVKNVKFQAT